MVITAWADRLAWSGETPLDYPDLNPVAAQRFNATDAATGSWADAVDPANVWQLTPWEGSLNGTAPGPWGPRLAMNTVDPATEQGVLTLPFFEGLWPSSGKLLLGLLVKQRYTMTFNPLMSSRSGNPIAYLSTSTNGRIRHTIYSAAGGSLLDYYEGIPFGASTDWQWIAMLVDLDAQTSRMAAVDPVGHGKFLSPIRTLSGPPNPASTAPLEVFALPGSGYWTGGEVDEVLVAHPGASFDFEEYVERLRLGSWARGSAPDANGVLTVSDAGVTASDAYLLPTGAEQVSWTGGAPEPARLGAIPHWSSDSGATWQTGELPASFTGLLRWEIPLEPDEVFTGLTLLPPPPAIDEIPQQTIPQQGSLSLQLEGSWPAEATWTAAAVGVTASITQAGLLTISTGWATGEIQVTVSVRDSWGRTASRSFVVEVPAMPWTPAPPPQYPRAPIVIWGEDGAEEAIIGELSAVVTQELNGEHTLEFSIPHSHRAASAILPERMVELAGERYRIRRITDGRKGRAPVKEVYCEAAFYDLAYAGQISAREYLQVPAGTAIEEALEGTGWEIAAVTVGTRRSYSIEDCSPLELLRTIQQQHGGDLLFDTVERTVSLVSQSGRDVGVSFFYGRGLTESKRVVDTTSLVTRIYARNEEGVTIAGVNGGVPYVEDFSWTDEVREATYDFGSGVSPFTMLAMSQATLAHRSRPSFSYEFTVADLSHQSGQEIDRFDVGDMVTVVDDEIGIRETQRILKVEHDVARPWASKVTLSGKLRELGGSSSSGDAGELTTGTGASAFDLVPFNLLRNGRFDNALAHWAASGVSIVEGSGTGDFAVRFQGSGQRWIEQTVQPDNRDVYSLSLRASSVGGGSVPPLRAVVTVEYEDGSSDSIPVDLV